MQPIPTDIPYTVANAQTDSWSPQASFVHKIFQMGSLVLLYSGILWVETLGHKIGSLPFHCTGILWVRTLGHKKKMSLVSL